MTDHFVPGAPKCPTCKALLDGAMNVRSGEVSSPEPGSITICAYCGDALQFTKKLTLKALTMIEIEELPPEAVEDLMRASVLIEAIRKGMPKCL